MGAQVTGLAKLRTGGMGEVGGPIKRVPNDSRDQDCGGLEGIGEVVVV